MLSLPPDEMRRLGYRVVDRIVDHFERVGDLPPIRVGQATDLQAALGGPPPEAPSDPDAALDALFEQVLPFIQHPDHPRFFARIGSPSNFVSVLADAAASGFNVFAGSWTGGSGPAAVELVVLDWLRELCGLPEGADGVLVSGGSVASLVALAAARERAPDDAVVYVSSEGHASIPRALRLLDLRYVVVPARNDHRLHPDDVRMAMVAEGGTPFCVVATAGTTSTGAVDPLEDLAELGLWLHVDGAYGAPAALTGALTGLEHADSLVLDPHKWLFQPYEIGCVLMREPGLLERTFSLSGVYLRDTMGEEVNFRDRSVQLTRTSRALKLWLSLRIFGVAAFREAIAHGIALAEHAERVLRAREGWEVVSPAQLAIVCFRREGVDQTRLAAAMVDDGFAAPSTTEVGGRVALRLCTINPRTMFEDIERTIERMEQLSGSCA
ncbi:MAG TPA: aminotransferase class V-fold PLP-dependent enzyme [Solirubrobacteraceae bacterium]|nr:aminotransferase class V-fold PLP-dependent enzyme [Solirubrobacteraceae bacterium]